MLVLPEERDQAPAELAQVRRGGRATLNERAGAPGRGHPPCQHELALVRRRQPLAQLGQLGIVEQLGRRGEHALDVGLLGPGSHDAGPRLAAQQQVERVRQDSLAGAGLARDHVQALAEPQLGPLDQQ